ncbi:MAG: glycosyltransferase family 39 protein [Gemmatimonadota bacterium]|nr:glycosyltransferase family 39 protein [Gemmatimonadota bacterium]
MPRRLPTAEFLRRIGWALPALAALAFGVVRLPELTRSPLWFDELFSVGVAGLPLTDSLRRIVADHTNPPLFYLLLKGWMAIGGESDQWVRLLPCVLAMLLGAALVWLARETRAGGVAGTLAVALAAASPLLVDLANEVRAYSLLALLACLSLAAVLHDRRVRSRHTFALLTVVNVALVHTHYFGWLTVAAACIVVVSCWPRDDARRVLRSAAYTALAFVPWAGAVGAHMYANPAPLRNVAWIAPPDAAAPLWLLRDVTGRSGSAAADLGWLALVVGALVLLAVARWRRTTSTSNSVETGSLKLLAAAGVAVPLTVWIVSVFSGHSVWVQRYLIGAAAPLALLVAIAVTALPPRRWAAGAAVGFAWCAVALAALPTRAPTKFDWRRFVRRIDVTVGSPANLYAVEAFIAAPLQRYARAGMRVHMVATLDQIPRDDGWLVYRPESFASRPPADRLRAIGFTVVTALSAETAGQKVVAVRLRRAPVATANTTADPATRTLRERPLR